MPTLGIDGSPPAHEDGAEAGARLRSVLDAAIDAIITIDENGIIDAVNPAVERMFGYRAAEVMGQNVSMLMNEHDRDGHDGYIDRYRRTGERRIIGVGREVEARRKDGTLFPCDLAISEFRVRGKRMFTGIMRDISDRRQAQQVAQGRLEELAHAGRLADLGLTTSTIAHEVNQPLTAIVGFATACQRMLESGNYEPETLRGALAQIAEQGARASGIITRIRHLARKREPASEPVSLNSAVRSVMSMMGDDVRLSRTQVSLLLQQDVSLVMSDRVHVEQVVMNLVRNALEAMRNMDAFGGRLTLRTAEDGEFVTLECRDNGPGLGVDGENKAFEGFYTTKANGMGVGLAICRSLAEAHGGRLWAEPGCGRGAAFHFSLPRVES